LKRGHNIKYLPYAFTEQGVAMLSSVLNSDRAVEVNIAIMRAFVRLREKIGDKKIKDQKRVPCPSASCLGFRHSDFGFSHSGL
jgi:hypothetical protein